MQSKNAFAAEETVQETIAGSAPTATPASETIDEDTLLRGQVYGSDPNGDPLTFEVAVGPSHGSIEFKSNGTYSYLPLPNYYGSDSFSFIAKDGTALSAAATVSITINSINDVPWGVARSVSTIEDTKIVGKLVGLDLDAGTTLTYSVATAPVNGLLSLNSSTGDYAYTPNPGYSGSDSFTFKVYDGVVYSAPVTIKITVTALNDPPEANPAEATVKADTVLEGVLSGTDLDGDDLTFMKVSDPAHGNLTINTETGVYTYTPAADFTGQDSFTFSVSDGSSISAPATVTIMVNSDSHAPIANDARASTKKGKALKGTLSGTDVDPGTTLTFAIATKPKHGTVKVNAATGAYTYKPAAGYTGKDSFTFTVSNGELTSEEATVSIKVKPKNAKNITKIKVIIIIRNNTD